MWNLYFKYIKFGCHSHEKVLIAFQLRNSILVGILNEQSKMVSLYANDCGLCSKYKKNYFRLGYMKSKEHNIFLVDNFLIPVKVIISFVIIEESLFKGKCSHYILI